MTINIQKALFTGRSIITANSPSLLVGAAIVGVVSTGVLAARGGYKARGIVDEERARRALEATEGGKFENFEEFKAAAAGVPDLSVQEKVGLTWLCYAVPAVTGASTIASVLGVHTIHTKRHAALAGLYAVTSGKLDDYREKAEELLGTKKTQQLNDSLAQEHVDRNPIINNEVIVLDGGSELMYDEFSGRYFKGSVPMVEKALGEVNLELSTQGSVAVNDYWDHLGLPPLKIGLEHGWSGTRVAPRFGSVTTSDGRSAVSVWFHEEPSISYNQR